MAETARATPDVCKDDLFDYVLRLGDNALITGQRLAEWVRNAPSVELDMAFGNFALDHVGQARMLLTYAGEIEGKGRDEDGIAFLRDGEAFRNLLITELPNGDFGQTMLRLFFYSAWLKLLYTELLKSSDKQLAAIAEKALKEVSYHLKHSADWVIRLGDGTDESHSRMENAVHELWPYTAELFMGDALEARVAAAGIGVDVTSLRDAWDELVDEVFARATLQRPDVSWQPEGGRRGMHTEHLGYLLAEMQYMQRTYPGCTW